MITPCTAPYSSTTNTRSVLDAAEVLQQLHARQRLGHEHRRLQVLGESRPLAARQRLQQACAATSTPMHVVQAAAAHRVARCGRCAACARACCSSGAPASSQTISARGIIIEPICRSSRRNTLRTIWCSCASITPASTPSSRLAAISSSVTLRDGAAADAQQAQHGLGAGADSSQTNGRVAVDSQFIGRATSRATVSGYIWPRRLGTSSPKMMVRIGDDHHHQRGGAMSAAACARSPKRSTSQAASGSANAASPTMPLSTPIEVMPICTVDSNLVGLSCRSIAACAPGSLAFDHDLQPRLAAGGERHLGHGEHAVEQDQKDQKRNVHARPP